MVSCPICDAVIDVEEDDLDEGDRLSCDECGASIRVSGLDPLELESEDGDEDEDEDFEEYDEEEYSEDGEEENEEEEEDW
jgi:alpha-aminoadipate carrier protein LysW